MRIFHIWWWAREVVNCELGDAGERARGQGRRGGRERGGRGEKGRGGGERGRRGERGKEAGQRICQLETLDNCISHAIIILRRI